MSTLEIELQTVQKIADILHEAELTTSVQLGLLAILQHSIIQAAMNTGKN